MIKNLYKYLISRCISLHYIFYMFSASIFGLIIVANIGNSLFFKWSCGLIVILLNLFVIAFIMLVIEYFHLKSIMKFICENTDCIYIKYRIDNDLKNISDTKYIEKFYPGSNKRTDFLKRGLKYRIEKSNFLSDNSYSCYIMEKKFSDDKTRIKKIPHSLKAFPGTNNNSSYIFLREKLEDATVTTKYRIFHELSHLSTLGKSGLYRSKMHVHYFWMYLPFLFVTYYTTDFINSSMVFFYILLLVISNFEFRYMILPRTRVLIENSADRVALSIMNSNDLSLLIKLNNKFNVIGNDSSLSKGDNDNRKKLFNSVLNDGDYRVSDDNPMFSYPAPFLFILLNTYLFYLAVNITHVNFQMTIVVLIEFFIFLLMCLYMGKILNFKQQKEIDKYLGTN